MAFINDNPPPATVILISGDRDFAYLLSTVRWRKHNVVLISNSSMTHKSLAVQASVAYDWKSDILNARPPSSKPLLFRSQTLLSAAALTTLQESENQPESDVHVDPLKERVAPAIQPPTLFPRPTSPATISTTRPRRATLPPDALPVDSGAAFIPPKTGTPPKTASASVSSNPASNHRIETNLAGGSIMVYPPAVHAVVVDSIFRQGPVLPKPSDRIEGGIHSPSSVSMFARMYPHSAANPRTSEFSGNDSTKG